jgi:hypothetical protein
MTEPLGPYPGSSPWPHPRPPAPSTSFARVVGAALVAIGLLGTAVWGWVVVRQQLQIADDSSGPFFGFVQDPSLADRIDVSANSIVVLLFAGMCVGLGCALRLGASEIAGRAAARLAAAAQPPDRPPPGTAVPSRPRTIDDAAWGPRSGHLE